MDVRKPFACFVLSALIVVTFLGCGGGSSSNDEPEQQLPYVYTPPADIGDGWVVGDLNQLDINPAPLENLINKIQDGVRGYRLIDSVAVAQNGQLIFEKRTRTELDRADDWAGNRDIELHVLNSVTKSVTSALIGIAIDRGEIAGVDVLVHDYFPEKQPVANWTAEKASINVENWLNMRSGYQWNEWTVNYLNPANLNAQMNNSADPIQFLLDRPMATLPGTSFAYSTGISFGLGRIIEVASGQSVAEYLDEHLLQPLQINSFDFWALDGQLHTGSALYLTTRDMVKFGQLYLDGGVWNGTRVISENWVNESTQQRVNFAVGGYGYQWWMNEYTAGGQTYSAFYGNGFGGQFIYIFPELELVIALTGHAYEDAQGAEMNTRAVLETDILPSFLNP